MISQIRYIIHIIDYYSMTYILFMIMYNYKQEKQIVKKKIEID